MEQPGLVAAGHLAEVLDSVRERPRLAGVPVHGRDQPVEAALDKAGVLLAPVVQDVRGPVHPAVGARDVRPQRSRALQAAGDQLAQPRQPRGAAPFSATRSRLAATFSSRLLSVRPEAASGGRPSSVIALRTAAQSPRTISAAAASEPSTARSIRRIPRTCFLSSTFACRSASKIG